MASLVQDTNEANRGRTMLHALLVDGDRRFPVVRQFLTYNYRIDNQVALWPVAYLDAGISYIF
jgi:hypothetical protein